MIMAGGTGGHIFPALAIADEFKQQNYQIVWLGTKGGMESEIVARYAYQLELIDFSGVRGTGVFNQLLLPFKLLRALWQTMKIFNRSKPLLTVGMGGFVTVPGGLVSWLFRCPLVIHEQNAISGMSNNILARLSRRCICAFPAPFKNNHINKKCILVGNPVRKEIIKLQDKVRQKQLNTTNILVLGGSRGALSINRLIPDMVRELAVDKRFNQQKYEIRHQCGQGKTAQVQQQLQAAAIENADNIEYDYFEFIDDMAQALGWANLVICRAGALTISEISVAGVASILIPYPYAVDDHQTKNARYLSDQGAALLLSEEQLNLDNLMKYLAVMDDNKLQQMAEQAFGLAKPDATQDVVRYSLECIAE
jgi:UDP-N-acetylglucosamine--N-acetylmuramyl-(pentapeptide) pyrophosphoryl-undecaprenol N-acetylglucosamine transferase